MSPLHFSGSLWFLLLLPPGLYILWRQYQGGTAGREAGFGRRAALLALQAAALLLLVVSLTGPEWVRRKAEFHNPAVLILRDQSGSFRAGGYLGLGEAYAGAGKAIAKAYSSRGFAVKEADFHERAWPVSGFKGTSPSPGRGEPAGGGDVPLTSLAAAADFLDSAAIMNLQAVFLFSDGRPCLDSGKAGRTWPAPVFPVVLRPRGVSEAQPERVALGAPDGGQGNLEVTWSPVGPPSGNPRLRVLKDGKPVFSADLPAGGGEDGPRAASLPWKPGSAAPSGAGSLVAVLQPAGDGANFDPWNDTLPVVASADGAARRRILVAKPLRSLDEKGMADLLHAWEEAKVEMADPEALASPALTARDQVWIEAAALAGRPALLASLRATAARVVVYTRPGSAPAAIAGTRARLLEFSPGAEVRPARAAADVFPDGVVRLKGVSAGPLAAPASERPWREAATLSEGGRRGLLMAWFPLAPGKEGLFLALPPIWNLLFDPQADFAVRENLEGLLRAAALLAERQEGAVKATLPSRAHAGLPFDLEYAIPPARDGKPGDLEVAAAPAGGSGKAATWALPGPGPELFRLEGRTLSAGTWVLELRRGGERIRRDSLVVAPKAALELARIGFDRPALEDLAAQSGGRLIAPASPGAAGAGEEVTNLLPDLPGAQIKTEQTTTIRLHNTRWQFLLAAALLSLSWFLRKRWDLD